MNKSVRTPLGRKSALVFLVALLSLFMTTGAFAQRTRGDKVIPANPQKVDEKGGKKTPDYETTIVGGSEATAGQFPYQVRLTLGGYMCGGSLIAVDWVLTAAHCVTANNGSVIGASTVTAYLGDHDRTVTESGEQVKSVSQIIRHESYNENTMVNDVALLKLSSPATLSSKVALIALAKSPDNDASVAAGVNATVSGWGTTSSGGSTPSKLRYVVVPIVSNTTCNSSVAYNGEITADMLCAGLAAGGKDSCQGDSGGPLAVNNGTLLAGVVSWGYGCATANKYGVYARVTHQYNWITGKIGGVTPPPPPPPTGGSLVNGGFEGTSGWTQSSTGGYQIIATTRPRTGSSSAYLGGYNSGTDNIYQTVTVPTNGQLKYYWYMSSQEGTSTVYDRMYVRLYNTNGGLITTLRTWSNRNTRGVWALDTISLSAYAGQTVRLQFVSTTDSSLVTSFFVDDVTLQ